MNYKILVYTFNIMLCIFTLNGIHIEKIIKKDKIIEAKMLIMILSLVLAYLLTNFIFDFLSISKIM